jgi:hypothetical protein
MRQQIHSTSFLEADEVYRHLKASDVFMSVTNFTEKGGSNNKSGALAAAFAAGLPILGAFGDMTNKLLFKKSKLQWVNFNDNLKAIDTIKHLLENKQEQQLLSMASIEFYNNFLKWSQIYQPYHSILNKI